MTAFIPPAARTARRLFSLGCVLGGLTLAATAHGADPAEAAASAAADVAGQCNAARHTPKELQRLAFDELESWPVDEGEHRVRGIHVERRPIFDVENPDEDKWVYRAANRYHVDTREAVVRDVVFIRPGQPATAQQLQESERALRGKAYLYDARVLVNRICDDGLDVVIVTRDVWTLVPVFAVTRTGSRNEYFIGASDVNVKITHPDDIPLAEALLERDPTPFPHEEPDRP